MKKNFETIWVYRKDEKTNQLIKSSRFNPKLHKKLFWKNYCIKVFLKKINWNNPWIVGIGVGIILIVIGIIVKPYGQSLVTELEPTTQFPKEYIFGSQNYYVQALTDIEDKVIAYAVTTRKENFNPKITILRNAGSVDPGNHEKTIKATVDIEIGKDSFLDLNGYQGNVYLDKPDNIIATVGIRRFYYQEEYYFGNPGNYQSYFFVINDSGVRNYGKLPPSFYQDIELDPLDPEILEFRNKSTFNTFQITSPGEGWSNKELRKYMAGPDYDQMRVISESILESNLSTEEQLNIIKKLSTEVDIQFFIDLLGKPIVINKEPLTFLRDSDKTISERLDEQYTEL